MHRPLSEWDMALITVMCQEGEARCGSRARTAALAGDKAAEKAAITDQWRYRSLRLKMFALKPDVGEKTAEGDLRDRPL